MNHPHHVDCSSTKPPKIVTAEFSLSPWHAVRLPRPAPIVHQERIGFSQGLGAIYGLLGSSNGGIHKMVGMDFMEKFHAKWLGSFGGLPMTQETMIWGYSA